MTEIRMKKNKYPQMFGGIGFHNNDATMYHVIEKEHFNQIICKCYREISPGFMRTFAGFYDWTKEAMDEFSEYYERMQKQTDTPMYLTPGMGVALKTEEAMQSYCEAVADNLAYLYFDKNVKHIRYFCFSNELSEGMYGVLEKNLPRFKQYHTMLYNAFQKRNLPIGLLATDASDYWWETMDWAIENMSDITEDYCLHTYERGYDIYDLTFYDYFYKKCAERVDKAVRNFGKRLILAEVGITQTAGQLRYNGNVCIDTCSYFENDHDTAYCALMLSEMIFAAINAGVFAIGIWSYIDHPDPYSCTYSTGDEYSKKWGEAQRYFSSTTDHKYNKWGVLKWNDDGDNTPRLHYWCIAPLIKFFKKNSKIIDIETSDPMLRICAVQNHDNSVSVGIVNRNKTETEITFDTCLFNKQVRVYEYDPSNVSFNRFGDLQSHCALLDKEKAKYTIKPESVTFFTTDYCEKTAPVYAENLKISNGELSWNGVKDKNHCYYRVFASDKENFTPQSANQIASTVATRIPIDNEKSFYQVLSVDKSGNI